MAWPATFGTAEAHPATSNVNVAVETKPRKTKTKTTVFSEK